MAGIFVALIGIAIVSYAGHQKEQQMGTGVQEFNVKLGLLLAVMCGIFSSGMSFAIDAATPIANKALHLGVNPLYAALPTYVIIMGGGARGEFRLLLRPPWLQKRSLAAPRPEPDPRNALEEWHAGRRRRHHVVLPVLLLRMGSRPTSRTGWTT